MTGQQFRKRRERLGYSQESLAKRLGLHRCSIIRAEQKAEVSKLWSYAIKAVPPKPPWKERTTVMPGIVAVDLTDR
jgi:DNA-binding XRE family transcriptional regulator